MNNLKQDLENTITMLEDYESEYFLKTVPLQSVFGVINNGIEILSLIEYKGLTLETITLANLYLQLSNNLFQELSWIRYLPFKFERIVN